MSGHVRLEKIHGHPKFTVIQKQKQIKKNEQPTSVLPKRQ
jgi:hypothetical protein